MHAFELESAKRCLLNISEWMFGPIYAVLVTAQDEEPDINSVRPSPPSSSNANKSTHGQLGAAISSKPPLTVSRYTAISPSSQHASATLKFNQQEAARTNDTTTSNSSLGYQVVPHTNGHTLSRCFGGILGYQRVTKKDGVGYQESSSKQTKISSCNAAEPNQT
jgi:hypothetical protein